MASWLGAGGDAPAPCFVRQILVEGERLDSALERQDGLGRRIRRMREDQRAFADEADSTAQTLGKSLEEESALEGCLLYTSPSPRD